MNKEEKKVVGNIDMDKLGKFTNYLFECYKIKKQCVVLEVDDVKYTFELLLKFENLCRMNNYELIKYEETKLVPILREIDRRNEKRIKNNERVL